MFVIHRVPSRSLVFIHKDVVVTVVRHPVHVVADAARVASLPALTLQQVQQLAEVDVTALLQAPGNVHGQAEEGFVGLRFGELITFVGPDLLDLPDKVVHDAG